MKKQKKLYRSRKDVMLSGVCAGIAKNLDLDPTLIRLLWAVSVLFGGTGFVAYIICAIIIPKEPLVEGESDEYEYYDSNSGYGQSRESDSDVEDYEKNDNVKVIIGLGMIGVGTMFILNKFIPWISMDLFWPIILIIIGAVVIMKGRGE